jgi:hypothetical protein
MLVNIFAELLFLRVDATDTLTRRGEISADLSEPV